MAPGSTHEFNGRAMPVKASQMVHDPHRVHPRGRAPLPFDRPLRFFDRGPHYFGYRINYLPTRYVVHTYWGIPYYSCDGIWYRHYGTHYYICRPPFGVFFDPILDDVVLTACRFAYYYDVYNTFNTINDNARTITEQNATIAANNALIAQQNAQIAMNATKANETYSLANSLGLVQSYAGANTEYFYQDGVFFVKGANGKYTVIVPPAGALVQELPDDYDVITIGGQEYYKVDDTVYRMTVSNGTAYFEVLGQLTGELANQYNMYKD